jgi:hypothetical protein
MAAAGKTVGIDGADPGGCASDQNGRKIAGHNTAPINDCHHDYIHDICNV